MTWKQKNHDSNLLITKLLTNLHWDSILHLVIPGYEDVDLDPEQVSNDLEVSPFPIGVEAPFRLEEGNELLPISKYLNSARNFPFKRIENFI